MILVFSLLSHPFLEPVVTSVGGVEGADGGDGAPADVGRLCRAVLRKVSRTPDGAKTRLGVRMHVLGDAS